MADHEFNHEAAGAPEPDEPPACDEALDEDGLPKRIVAVIGMSRAGKTTHARLIAERLGLRHLDFARLVADRAGDGTSAGNELARCLRSGQALMEDHFADLAITAVVTSRRGVVFDGYPNNPTQCKLLLDALADMDLRLNALVYVTSFGTEEGRREYLTYPPTGQEFGNHRPSLPPYSEMFEPESGEPLVRVNVDQNVLYGGYHRNGRTDAMQNDLREKGVTIIPVSGVGNVDDTSEVIAYQLAGAIDAQQQTLTQGRTELTRVGPLFATAAALVLFFHLAARWRAGSRA